MNQPVFSIFQGDSKSMPLKALLSPSLDPYDLTSCTAIVVNLPKADGTFAALTLASGKVTITSPAVLGKFACQIDSSVSSLLQPGELQNVDVQFTIAGAINTVQFTKALSVFES